MIRNYRLGKLALATTGGGELRALIDAELEPIGVSGDGAAAAVEFNFPGESPVAGAGAGYDLLTRSREIVEARSRDFRRVCGEEKRLKSLVLGHGVD